MAKMSLKYGLSKRYTNHSVRVTALQLLDDNNIKDRHVVRVSGHKSTDSIKNYARRLSASRKRNISSVISKHIANPTFKLVSDDVFDPSVAHTASSASSIIRESPNNATSSCSTIRRQSANNNNALVNSSDHDDDIFMNVPNKMLVAPSPLSNREVPFPSGPSSSASMFRPVLYNCHNCTINFNINTPSTSL